MLRVARCLDAIACHAAIAAAHPSLAIRAAAFLIVCRATAFPVVYSPQAASAFATPRRDIFRMTALHVRIRTE
jgi:hypothetical protein